MTGKIVVVEHESEVLKKNPLGDPFRRRFPVYLPPGYEASSHQRYPVIFGLAGFTANGFSYLNRKFLTPSFDRVLDQLILEKGMPGVIYVMPDCMTYFGGSQYVNSSAVGDYEDYLVKELVPFIDAEFRTLGTRGCVGGSSGGVGSFSLAAKHPDVFQAFADHSGDSGFDSCFLADIPRFVQAIEKYDYKVENFVKRIPEIQPHDGSFMTLINLIAMSACYSPNSENRTLGFDLPFDVYTGEVNTKVWSKWLQFDPVQMADRYQDGLKKLRLAYIDCGKRDQFHLFLGARQLHRKLQHLEIAHHYEEYDSDHGLLRKIQKRKSIPMVVRALLG